MKKDTIDQKILSKIIEFKISNKTIYSITLGHNQLIELKKTVEFEIPKDSGFIGSAHGVKILSKNKDDYFEINEDMY